VVMSIKAIIELVGVQNGEILARFLSHTRRLVSDWRSGAASGHLNSKQIIAACLGFELPVSAATSFQNVSWRASSLLVLFE
jgi:hypothetical protein